MGVKIRFSPGFCVGLALAVLILPFQWLFALIAAATFHELCHMLAIYACGRSFGKIRLDREGARILLPRLNRKQELFCALAGPLGGLFLLLLIKYIPYIAVCGAFQSAYNLLPVYPLDGGRALKCLLSMLLPPPKVKKWEKVISASFMIVLVGIVFYCSAILNFGLFPACIGVFILLRRKFGKIPCQEPGLGVQ